MEPAEIFAALLSSEGRADPYPLYAARHEHGEVLGAGGFVLVPGYDAANAVLRDPAFRVADAVLRGFGSLPVCVPVYRLTAQLRLAAAPPGRMPHLNRDCAGWAQRGAGPRRLIDHQSLHRHRVPGELDQLSVQAVHAEQPPGRAHEEPTHVGRCDAPRAGRARG